MLSQPHLGQCCTSYSLVTFTILLLSPVIWCVSTGKMLTILVRPMSNFTFSTSADSLTTIHPLTLLHSAPCPVPKRLPHCCPHAVLSLNSMTFSSAPVGVSPLLDSRLTKGRPVCHWLAVSPHLARSSHTGGTQSASVIEVNGHSAVIHGCINTEKVPPKWGTFIT